MRKLAWPCCLFVFLLLQGSLSVFFNGWLSCDLLLLAVYAMAVLAGSKVGGYSGLAVGLLQDGLATGVFGFHLLTRGLVGWLFGKLKGKVFKENYFFHIWLTGLACLGLRFCYWWLLFISTGGSWRLLPAYLWSSLGYCLGNMLLTVPIFHLCYRLKAWQEEEDVPY